MFSHARVLVLWCLCLVAEFARFERHHSTNAENAAIAFKVFVFQFINTALVTLMVFGRMPNGVTVPGQSTLNYFSVRVGGGVRSEACHSRLGGSCCGAVVLRTTGGTG